MGKILDAGGLRASFEPEREVLNLKTEMAEGESAVVIGPTRLPASRVASSYRCNRCEPGSHVEPCTTPFSSLSIPVSRLNLKTEMAEGESAVVIGPTRLPASRVASPFRCNRCEPESHVEPSTTPSSSLSIPVSRLTQVSQISAKFDYFCPLTALEPLILLGGACSAPLCADLGC
jgi:hypothetical protein